MCLEEKLTGRARAAKTRSDLKHWTERLTGAVAALNRSAAKERAAPPDQEPAREPAPSLVRQSDQQVA